ncbi:uncharacterized protein DNG_05690 [Cephalotrichum gorgonifer]|uniref:NTF2-like domain-containing protein n=1 Tax=Cephalotrichum gorgonifer TaxID=2041049 RepID=A0AAE8N0B8_9PEZI|nr:uncharacterized protein DNG_05690 [Cephalotrichum gorgonifer]
MRASVLALAGLAAVASASSRYPRSYGANAPAFSPRHAPRFSGRYSRLSTRQEDPVAEPEPVPEPAPERCMTREEADHIVDVYAQSITAFDEELLETYLTDDFVDISDSINMFIHQPLGGPTFDTKPDFIEKQRLGLHFPVDVLSVDAYDCASVALQWVSYFGQADLPAKGLTILKVAWEDERWKMSHIIVEFNALVWLVNMGGSYTWAGETYTGAAPDAGTLPYLYERKGQEPVEEAPVEEPAKEEPVEEEPVEEETVEEP